MLHHNHNITSSTTTPPSSSQIAASSQHNNDNKNNNNNGSTISASGVLHVPKRKRRPAGTPDPDAEVVCLSPKTLMESERYVCEICKKGFQREQNLQMHRRKHKVPWKLVKNKKNPNSSNPRRDDDEEEEEDNSNNNMNKNNNKKVFVCPEASCLHHDPCHALGDLVGIKKHFRRKHSNHKQWVCDKCSKAYAVLSDFKAHLKTCGTRGHSCDCGRVFSRVESFIEHQDSCTVRPLQGGKICSSSRTASNTTSPSTNNKDPNLSIVSDVTPLLLQGLPFPPRPPPPPHHHHKHSNILQELQLLRCSNSSDNRGGNHMEEEEEDEIENNHEETETHLKLSIGSSSNSSDDHNKNNKKSSPSPSSSSVIISHHQVMMSEGQVRLAMKEKAYAEEARREARREVEMAEAEFGRAKRLRKEAQEELQRAEALKEQAMMNIRSTLMHITCHPCKQLLHLQSSSQHTPSSSSSSSIVINYMSQTQGE